MSFNLVLKTVTILLCDGSDLMKWHCTLCGLLLNLGLSEQIYIQSGVISFQNNVLMSTRYLFLSLLIAKQHMNPIFQRQIRKGTIRRSLGQQHCSWSREECSLQIAFSPVNNIYISHCNNF